MPTLSESVIATLLAPYLPPSTVSPNEWGAESKGPSLYSQLSSYLDLLLKWNSRTNLTAIRDPEEIVRRHFGESLFAAHHLGNPDTLLDLGSGAGFPGLPIALLRPEIHVTLAESQNKKASFLREAVRTLSLKTEVWPNRAESLPLARQFHTVTLRAVDNMAGALAAAESRAVHQILLLTSASTAPALPNFPHQTRIYLPESRDGILLVAIRS